MAAEYNDAAMSLHDHYPGLLLRWFGAAAIALAAGPAAADTFTTKSGDKIEGELVEDRGETLRIRTLIGVIDIEKDLVVSVKKGPAPWKLYEDKRRACPDTAEAHWKLAKWCEKRGLHAERRAELETVIAIEPDHAAAREALGFVADGRGGWMRPPNPKAPTPEEQEARRIEAEQEKLLRRLITEWFIKVKAIARGRFEKERAGSAKFQKGRELILAIRDPLALPALTGVLSMHKADVRLVLVESLSKFPDDEATMNLLVMSIMDPSKEVRRRAALELIPRRDDRIVQRLQDALYSRDEGILRNAAVVLGILKAREAIEDLVGVLSTEVLRPVVVPTPVYLGDIYRTWGGYRRYDFGGGLVPYAPAGIGVLTTGSLVGTEYYTELQVVSIYRTEVQEALISITGQNFGFDGNAWLQWWQQNRPR